jgi:DNA-binding NtrC family response regulator
LATEVLLITKDDGLIQRIESGVNPEEVSVRFARSGYEGSAIISTFSPALVIMDSDLAEVRAGLLSESILEDDRIPAAKVVVACRKGHTDLFQDSQVTAIRAPFTAEEVVDLAESVIPSHTKVPLDVA